MWDFHGEATELCGIPRGFDEYRCDRRKKLIGVTVTVPFRLPLNVVSSPALLAPTNVTANARSAAKTASARAMLSPLVVGLAAIMKLDCTQMQPTEAPQPHYRVWNRKSLARASVRECCMSGGGVSPRLGSAECFSDGVSGEREDEGHRDGVGEAGS